MESSWIAVIQVVRHSLKFKSDTGATSEVVHKYWLSLGHCILRICPVSSLYPLSISSYPLTSQLCCVVVSSMHGHPQAGGHAPPPPPPPPQPSVVPPPPPPPPLWSYSAVKLCPRGDANRFPDHCCSKKVIKPWAILSEQGGYSKSIWLNTAFASKVGKFKPFLGEVKKLKGPLMGIFVFKYSNVKVQLLRQHWVHFVRDHSTCWMLQMRRYKRGHSDETLIHHQAIQT